MRKIYKLYIGIILSVIAVACSDNLDSDKYFKDRRSLEDVFTDKESTEEWLAHAYSFLGGYNLEVSNMLNTITNFADDIYFGGNSLDAYKTFKTGTYDESYRHSWGDSYKGIRQASIFIQNIDMNTKYTEEERADMKAQARLFVLTIIGCYFANMVLYLYYQMRGLTILPIMMIWQFNVVRMMNVWNILNRRCVWQPRICLCPEPLIRWRVPHGEQHWRLVPEH